MHGPINIRICSILYMLSGLRYFRDVGRISEFPRSFLLTPSRPAILANLFGVLFGWCTLALLLFSIVLPHFNQTVEKSVFGHEMALQTGTVSAGHQTTYRFFGMLKRETRPGISWCASSCCNHVLGRTGSHWHMLMDNWRAEGHFRAMMKINCFFPPCSEKISRAVI